MRVYTMSFKNVSVSATQDLMGLYSGSNGAIEVHSWVVGQVTATTVGNLRISMNRFPATVTAGSGGNAGTISAVRTGDHTATVTGRINDTTPMTTGGTEIGLLNDVYNPINGYQYLPPPEDREACNPSEAINVSLDQAPVSGETMSATIKFAELIPA